MVNMWYVVNMWNGVEKKSASPGATLQEDPSPAHCAVHGSSRKSNPRSDITLFHFLGISAIILLRSYLINSLSEGHGFNSLRKNAR